MRTVDEDLTEQTSQPELEDQLDDIDEIQYKHDVIIDRYSRIIFPATFFLFNITYFATCMFYPH